MLHAQLLVHIRDAIIAGSTGRMIMILVIYGGPLIGLPRFDAVSMLGALAAPNKQSAVTLGGAIHFTMGIVFAIIYAALWSVGIGNATWWWGLIFGAVHGLLVILLLLMILRSIPELSNFIPGFPALIVILLSHIAFGLVVALVYAT